MSLAAGATLLGAVGHLANLGQFVEIGAGHAYQREQMQWARRAYCLDSRALRIDLLNAVKEDVRDHHQTYAGRIDTLLLVHTLLLTFALATLQYSDQFVPSSDCHDCEENLHPWLVIAWVYSVSAILILPFWSMVMLIWSKLQLDRWLETSLGRLNLELRGSLATAAVGDGGGATSVGPVTSNGGAAIAAATSVAACSGSGGGGDGGAPCIGIDGNGEDLLDRVEGAVSRLSGFVVEHQESFKRIWGKECRMMIKAATCFLWVSCVLAISITAGMFWLFLQNHMEGAHRTASTHFAVCTLCGLLAPAAYALSVGGLFCTVPAETLPAEAFEDCIEEPLSLVALRAASEAAAGVGAAGGGALDAFAGLRSELLGGSSGFAVGDGSHGGAVAAAEARGGGSSDGGGRLRAAARRLGEAVRWPWSRGGGRVDSPRRAGAREPFHPDGWARMDDEGGLCMAERHSEVQPSLSGSCGDGLGGGSRSGGSPWVDMDVEQG